MTMANREEEMQGIVDKVVVDEAKINALLDKARKEAETLGVQNLATAYVGVMAYLSMVHRDVFNEVAALFGWDKDAAP